MQRLDDLYYVTISVWFDTRARNEMHQIQHSFSPIHSPITLFMKRQPVYLIYSFKGRIQIAHGPDHVYSMHALSSALLI